MSVRMRHTRGHTGNRRSHHALDAIKTIPSEKEGSLRLPHRIDEATGIYRGKQIAPAKAVKEKREHVHGTHHEHTHAPAVEMEKPAEAIAASRETKSKGQPRARSGMGGGA